ncbi:sigma-70 family RNA polymerase sigma factor [Cohnella endophytica]|uniref:Sigma-70 family RNA polymerase sigma factor n=1 Tax=Cohnella endophytica TaxID=2419778 RepID=A0A494XX23_9BACL|nr:sigma-70 family RNA polymerase sigma factor [Cohnella endophytica]RKP55052.1 sigma-70 family RNA polymerase sigma factor [Cohnella endophytica]
MEESILIDRLKQKQASALEEIMDKYVGYASTIVRNVIGDYMKSEDVEEVVSDVFALLWHNAERIREESTSIKSYLAAIARNQALKKLRNHNPRLCELEDDVWIESDLGERLEQSEKKRMLEWALSLMDESDREIFVRHYFFMEKTAAIANRLKMKESTVRSRLSRGRSYLRQVLTEGGYAFENENIGNV